MRRRNSGLGDVYATLLAEERTWWADVHERLGGPYHPDPRVVAMEAGEPVEFHAWQLPGQPSHYGLHPDDNVILGPDGLFEVVDRQLGAGGDVVSFDDARRRLHGPEVAP